MPPLSASTVRLLEPGDPAWEVALAKVAHDVFHTAPYADACGRMEGAAPRLLVLEGPSGGILVPILVRSLEAFGLPDHFDAASPYGYPSPLAWGTPSPQGRADLDAALVAALRERRIINLFLRLSPFLPLPGEIREILGDQEDHGLLVYIDLKEPDGGWHGMQSRIRSFVRSRERRGHRIVMDAWDTLEAVTAAYMETMERKQAPPGYLFGQAFFEQLRDAPGGHFHLATALSPEGEVMGGAFFTECQGIVHYFLTGTFERFAHESPGKLLINALREWGLAHGCSVVNLGGGLGSREDSLYHFKALFSPARARFSTLRRVIMPEVHGDLCGEISAGSFFPPYRLAGA